VVGYVPTCSSAIPDFSRPICQIYLPVPGCWNPALHRHCLDRETGDFEEERYEEVMGLTYAVIVAVLGILLLFLAA